MLLYDTLERFEKKFGHLKKKGLRINGLKMVDPKRKKHVIDVSRPLVFDNRLLPKTFEGLDDYIWAPERFEHFVDRCSLEIKKQLGNPAMSRDEVLSALCFGDYEAHKVKTQQMITEGKLPAYGKN